jgi:hypothetical protein
MPGTQGRHPTSEGVRVLPLRVLSDGLGQSPNGLVDRCRLDGGEGKAKVGVLRFADDEEPTGAHGDPEGQPSFHHGVLVRAPRQLES